MTIPAAAPAPAPSRPPISAQLPQWRGCCKYAQPVRFDASSARPARPATAFRSLDFSLMNSSSPKWSSARRTAHLAPEPRSCPIPRTNPPQLTGKYSYICNKNATRGRVRGARFFAPAGRRYSAQPGISVDKWWITTGTCSRFGRSRDADKPRRTPDIWRPGAVV